MKFFTKLFGKKVSNNLKDDFANNDETNVSQSNKWEDDFLITITDDLVRVEHPTRKTEEIFWKDIKEISYLNTDAGPFAPDLWLILTGDNNGCLIPHGTEGCEKVYDIVSKYNGFDFENVIEAMSSSENKQFLLWRKEENENKQLCNE